jgi:hypothetical protein
MSKKHMRNTMAKAALVASLAAGTIIPGTATAQSKPGANGSDSATHQVVRGPEQDPNMPVLLYPYPNAPIGWSQGGDLSPQVNFFRPPSQGTYLGFNAKGSWIKNDADGKVYVWNIKDATLTLGAGNENEVPLDLRNPSFYMSSGIIARATGHAKTGPQVANNNKGRTTPYIPPSVAGDGNAQQGSGETRTAIVSPNSGTGSAGAGTNTQVKGTAATVRAGVLTFTNEEGASVSWKVMRPPNQAFGNPNAPKPTGDAGAWLAEDPTDKSAVISLYITENGAVSGSEMTGMAAVALKRIMNTVPPQKQ